MSYIGRIKGLVHETGYQMMPSVFQTTNIFFYTATSCKNETAKAELSGREDTALLLLGV